jgi:ABC-type bacteriocin/lantibiotic exporter with double-glycine peptidase domain
MAQTVAAARDQRMEAPAGNVFAFAWCQSRRHQPWALPTAVLIFPLTMVPLELQRRIIDQAVGGQNLDLLVWLGAIYLGVVLLQGGLKYLLRVYAGMVSERTILDLRRAVHRNGGGEGETVSIVASEAEQVGGFVGEAFSEPILQGGILVAVLGYMLVVEPTIALVSLGFFVPQILLVPMIQQFINRRARREVQLVRELGDQIVDQATDQRYAGTTRQVYAVRMSYYRWKYASKLLNNFMNHLAPLSVLMVGGYSGDQRPDHARHGRRLYLRVRAHGGLLAPAARLVPARGRDPGAVPPHRRTTAERIGQLPTQRDRRR